MQKKNIFKSHPLKSTSFSERDSVTIVHLSDLHFACTDSILWRQLLNKRILGYLRWRLGRKKEFDYRIFDILERELQQIKPDQIIITGDLTHLGLPSEFSKITKWLKRLAPPEKITIVPGNHDTYVEMPWAETFSMWEGYILPYSTYDGRLPPPGIEDVFPTVHQVANVAVIGLSTAVPSPWHLATGRVGSGQLDRLKSMLKDMASKDIFRILALHHPPVPGVVESRKALSDAPRLVRILENYGCELVLHGHSHQISRYALKGPLGQIPVIEASSALCVRASQRRRARYFICGIRRCADEAGWLLKVQERILSNVEEGFGTGISEELRIRVQANRLNRRS